MLSAIKIWSKWYVRSAVEVAFQVIQAVDHENLNLGSDLRKTEDYMASRGHHLTCQLQLTSTRTAHGCWIFLLCVCKTSHLIPWVLVCSSDHPPSYCQSDCSKSHDVTFLLTIVSWLPGSQGQVQISSLACLPASLSQIFSTHFSQSHPYPQHTHPFILVILS